MKKKSAGRQLAEPLGRALHSPTRRSFLEMRDSQRRDGAEWMEGGKKRNKGEKGRGCNAGAGEMFLKVLRSPRCRWLQNSSENQWGKGSFASEGHGAWHWSDISLIQPPIIKMGPLAWPPITLTLTEGQTNGQFVVLEGGQTNWRSD